MKQILLYLFLVFTFSSCVKNNDKNYDENLKVSSLEPLLLVSDPNPVNIRLRGVDIVSTISVADLDALKNYKGNVVRVLFTNPSYRFINEKDANGNYSLNANAFTILDQIVALCAARNLKVIIDPHTTPGALNDYTGNPGDRLWVDTKLQDMVVEMWRQISNHCHTGSSFILYDLYNEPFLPVGKPNAWNVLAKRIVVALRDEKQDKCEILLEPAGYQGNGWVDRIPNLPNLIIPKKANGVAYSNITVSPHLYTPEEYTHQGIGSYPVGGQFLGDTRNKMYNAINTIRSYQNNNSGLKILIGEFGVARVETDGDSYIAEAISAFEYYGWDWIYHSFREANPWNPEMALGTNEWVQPDSNTIRMNLLKDRWLNNSFYQ